MMKTRNNNIIIKFYINLSKRICQFIFILSSLHDLTTKDLCYNKIRVFGGSQYVSIRNVMS